MSQHNSAAATACAAINGTTANSPVVVQGESQHHFNELVQALTTHFQPANPAERAQVDKMAAARWRQNRAWTLMRQALDSGSLAGPKVLRYEAQNRRLFNSARAELKFLQDHRATFTTGGNPKKSIFLRFAPNPTNGHPAASPMKNYNFSICSQSHK